MGKLIVLKEISHSTRKRDSNFPDGRAKIPFEYEEAAKTVIVIDSDDLKAMMKQAAQEKGLDLTVATPQEKRELLKQMGYEPFLEILSKELAKERDFEWLSVM